MGESWQSRGMEPRVEIEGGWDTTAAIIDGRWLERTARRPDAEPRLRRQSRLLLWLTPRLPLPIPVPVVVGEKPLVVRHVLLQGEPIDPAADPAAHGRALAGFLRALHATPLDGAVARGVPGPAETLSLRRVAFARFVTEVVPLLPDAARAPASAVLDRLADAPADTLVHGDIDPGHVLVRDDAVTGIIDWGATRAGDPAKDLAWALHGAPMLFAAAVSGGYDLTAPIQARARDWHRVGPFYVAAHGLDTGDTDLVAEGVAALSALAPAASPAP